MVEVLNSASFKDEAAKKLFLVVAHMAKEETNVRQVAVLKPHFDKIREIIRGESNQGWS